MFFGRKSGKCQGERMVPPLGILKIFIPFYSGGGLLFGFEQILVIFLMDPPYKISKDKKLQKYV